MDQAKLTSRATSAIKLETKQAGLAISCISLFELAVAIERRRVTIPVPADAFFQEISEYARIMPITPDVALRAAAFTDPYPGDPMDRIIGATALVHGMRLVTADEHILQARAVPTVW